MILGYKDKKTRQFADGKFVKAFSGFESQAVKRLVVLDAATCLDDLRALPSNHLEMLSGRMKGSYSIRINKQWRICFDWGDGANGPSGVEIIDYHG